VETWSIGEAGVLLFAVAFYGLMFLVVAAEFLLY
jgi:hypothetical protein